LKNTGVDRAAEVFEKRAKKPAIDVGAIARAVDRDARYAISGLRIADPAQEGTRSQSHAGSAESRKEATS
jgi:hypothetical protein